jgi:hypothetical protein
MTEFINQPVVDWARQTLVNRVEVQLRYSSPVAKVFLGLAIGFLALVFFGVPIALAVGAIFKAVNEGWSDAIPRYLGCSGGMFIVFAALFSAIIFLPRMTRKTFAKFMDREGVTTRNGQKYRWEKLYYLDYKSVSVARGNLAVAATQAAIMAGSKRVTVELIFEAGKAAIPPLTANQPELLALLETMPVQRRDDGQVRQN